MHNQETKNWNNFFLGLAVVILPWLSLPEKLQAGLISFFALLIVLFSLARLGPKRGLPPVGEAIVDPEVKPTEMVNNDLLTKDEGAKAE